MNQTERLNLQKMISANDVVDQTNNIRQLKHSGKIWHDVQQMTLLKKKYARIQNSEGYKSILTKHCNFLFTYYTDIFNKLLKDELNVEILYCFINELRNIENGNVDQHEASFKIGKLLKELYVDAALKKAESLDKNGKKIKYVKAKKISWKEFKQINDLDK